MQSFSKVNDRTFMSISKERGKQFHASWLSGREKQSFGELGKAWTSEVCQQRAAEGLCHLSKHQEC